MAAVTLPPIRERAEAGAARLSLRTAGVARWWEYIHLGSLNVGSCHDCVLGQVYGSFSLGLEQLGLDDLGAMALGFSTHWDEGDAEDRQLAAAWEDLVLAAREAAAA